MKRHSVCVTSPRLEPTPRPRSSSVVIDQLTIPASSLLPPLSPGALSQASDWSELMRLAEDDAEDEELPTFDDGVGVHDRFVMRRYM